LHLLIKNYIKIQLKTFPIFLAIKTLDPELYPDPKPFIKVSVVALRKISSAGKLLMTMTTREAEVKGLPHLEGAAPMVVIPTVSFRPAAEDQDLPRPVG
jgi:hypothetical protein